MDYTIRYDPQENIVFTRVTGKVSTVDIKQIVRGILRVTKRENCNKMLTDLREAEWGLSTIETFFLPEALLGVAKEEGVTPYQLHRAFVVAKGNNMLSFYEDVSLNRGISTRLFHTIEDAKNYLQKKPELENRTPLKQNEP